MTPLHDGQKVAYVGEPTDVLNVGDYGLVVSASGNCAHVLWKSGMAMGKVDLYSAVDLVPVNAQATVASQVDDSLDDGTLVTVAVRDVYETQGDAGLLDALNDAGYLTSFAQIVDEVANLVVNRIGSEPAIRSVLAQLDADERASFLNTTANTLMRDAFGASDG